MLPSLLLLLLLLLPSHFSRVRLCNLMDSSPPGSQISGILQARTLEWIVISFSSAWEWKVKLKSLSHVRLFKTPWTVAYHAPPSVGFSRQEYWCGFPLPSPSCVFSGLIYSVLDLLISWYSSKSPLCPGVSFLFLWMVPIHKQTDNNVASH